MQRIFYLHVSAFAGAFVAFGATVVGGLAYLRTRNPKWDTLAMAGVEVGLALALMNLITGSIWACPIWNTWWTWDPRLTSDAIMCLTYVAYLMLRQGIENPETRRRFAAVYGILAFSTAIITLIITRIRPDTIHPVVIGNNPQNAQGGFQPDRQHEQRPELSTCVVWSILVPWALVWWRIRLENHESARAGTARSVDGAVDDVMLLASRTMFRIPPLIYFLRLAVFFGILLLFIGSYG